MGSTARLGTMRCSSWSTCGRTLARAGESGRPGLRLAAAEGRWVRLSQRVRNIWQLLVKKGYGGPAAGLGHTAVVMAIVSTRVPRYPLERLTDRGARCQRAPRSVRASWLFPRLYGARTTRRWLDDRSSGKNDGKG